MNSNEPKPCRFPRFFINRLPAVILTTVLGLAAVSVIIWVLIYVGVERERRDAGFVELAVVCLMISSFGVFFDRIYLSVAQPNNPYKFSNEFRYFLDMPRDFSLRSDDLPLYWKLILKKEDQAQYELQTPIDEYSRIVGEAGENEGLSLILTFSRPKGDHSVWQAVVEHPRDSRSWRILPDRFFVPWFSPTILGEVEKFFVHQGLIDFLIDEKGRRTDFTWNSYVLQEPVD